MVGYLPVNHMSKGTLSYKIATLLLSLIVSLGTFVSLWPSHFLDAPFNESFAQKLMFLFLGIGMVFFLMNRSRFMVICFAGCAVICFQLNERSHSAFKPSLTQHRELIRVGIYNLYPEAWQLEESLEAMCNSNTDLISIKAIPPQQFMHIQQSLKGCGYQYHHLVASPYDTTLPEVIFAKQALTNLDTLTISKMEYDPQFPASMPIKSQAIEQVFMPDEFKYLKFEAVRYKSDLLPLGVIQTYQLIHQEPALNVKKTLQKL